VKLNAQRLGMGFKVTCIAKNPFSESDIQLVVGTQDKLVQVWNVDMRRQMCTIFSVQLNKTVPKGVTFSERSEDVHVFGMYNFDV
jgi:hypothetical protein